MIISDEPVDTTAICRKNPLYDLIYSESGTQGIYQDYSGSFPFLFTGINKKRESEAMGTLRNQLKDGKDIPPRQFHSDWMILIVIISATLYATLSAFYGRLFREVKRFLLFRGIGDPIMRDTGTLFIWKSTLLNLISFFNIALFSFCAAEYYDIFPDRIPGFVIWLICFAIIVAGVTSRHIISYLTGKMSNGEEIFDEYLLTYYQSYRFMGLGLFILTILLSYTSFLTPKSFLISGFIIAGFFYLMRVLRLFLIFMKRNTSILYLILYLCALEFLPVLVLLKYLTGLF
jgi:Domain of unknown function (DUF4271)